MKNKISIFSLVLFLSVFILLISCGEQKPKWKGTIEKENGVTVIKNPKEPLYSGDILSLEEDLTIGEEGKEHVFEAIRTIRVDNDGNIYVLDWKASQIKVFDKDGKHLRDISRKGQGPGEMQFPQSMAIISGKEIMLNDLRTRRFSFFSLDGGLLREISSAKVRMNVVAPDSSGNFIGTTFSRFGEKSVVELKKYDPNLDTVFAIGQVEISYTPGKVNLYAPAIFFTALKDDSILWGKWSDYQLMVVDREGNTTKKIIKDYDPIRITDKDKKREIKEVTEDSKGRITEKNLEFPEYYPAFRWISSDDEGRIFVRTFERDEEGNRYYDVFDSEGRYIAKIILRNHPTTWKKGKLYCAIEDEDEFHLVKRYKVKWKY